MADDFLKRLDDLIRQEISILGYEYGKVIAAVETVRGGGGAMVRMHPPFHDFTFDEPEEDVTDAMLGPRLRRRLRVAIEAPERPAASPDSV